MDVLQDEWQRVLAAILRPAESRLTDGAVRWIRPEPLVVRAAVVVAGETEQTREGQDEQCRRERQPSWPPSRLRTEPRVRRIAEQLGGVKGREIWTVGIMRVLERGPRGVHHEATENDEGGERREPPGVASQGLTKTAAVQRQRCRSEEHTSELQ